MLAVADNNLPKFTYAVLLHNRWLESEEPRATVMYTSDSFIWHEICTCAPEHAQDISFALQFEQDRRT